MELRQADIDASVTAMLSFLEATFPATPVSQWSEVVLNVW